MQSWEDGRLLLAPEALSDRLVPARMLERDAHVGSLAENLGTFAQGGRPIHSWLHGKPGVGKTAAARLVLRKLRAESGIAGVYVNCWEMPTFFSILDHIARSRRVFGIEKVSTAFKLERIKKHFEGQRIVIALDEVDKLPPQERNTLLYNLTGLPTVGLVCICNSQHVYFGLEERVRSRLNPARLHFGEYSTEELTAILEDRAHRALAPGAHTTELLMRIAQLAEGDARLAIQTLGDAAHMAERAGDTSIRPKHVERAWNSAKELRPSYLLGTLTEHHRILYKLVRNHPRVLSGKLWRLYLDLCGEEGQKPIAERTFSDYCNELTAAGLVKATRAAISGRSREFTAVQ